MYLNTMFHTNEKNPSQTIVNENKCIGNTLDRPRQITKKTAGPCSDHRSMVSMLNFRRYQTA